MLIEDRTIWLIGASSGIGAELAASLARRGARLAISARSEDQLAQVTERASAVGRAPLVWPLDVTEDGALPLAADAIRAELGPIDALIYGAAYWKITDVRAFDPAEVERHIAVNYVGLVRAVGAVLDEMLARRSGTIAGISSIAGYAGFPRAEAYGSTKAAVIAFLQSLRMDLASSGIDVVTVSPGFVDTPLTSENEFPMPFMISPREAAERIASGLLAGDAEIHFPKRASIGLKLLTALPRPVFEAVTRRIMARDR